MPTLRGARKSTRKKNLTRARVKKTIKFKQICSAPFTSATGSSYSVLGLGEDGRVYRFDPKCDAWIQWSNKIATCKADHLAGR